MTCVINNYIDRDDSDDSMLQFRRWVITSMPFASPLREQKNKIKSKNGIPKLSYRTRGLDRSSWTPMHTACWHPFLPPEYNVSPMSLAVSDRA